MGKAPAFQFYAAEYLADENVQLLTLEQEGAYIRLLAYCWREGSIPSDTEKLSRLCKNASIEVLSGVMELFEASKQDRMIHRRLEDERRKHEEYRQKQAINGARGGRPSRSKPDQSQREGSGLSDETRTKTEKRSVSAFASFSSTSSEDKGEELKTLALTVAVSDCDLERVYQAYPRHVGKKEAMKAIRAAVRTLVAGKGRQSYSVAEALEFLQSKASKFAASPAGNAGKFTAHPATWFNQTRYFDDEREWQHEANSGNRSGNRGQDRQNSALDALRRANAADEADELRRIDAEKRNPGVAYGFGDRAKGGAG